MDIYTRKGIQGRRILRFSKPLFNNRQSFSNNYEPVIELSADGQDNVTYVICLNESDINNIVESKEYHIAQGVLAKRIT